jgi:CheY-like chemotaxis protein
LGGSETVLVVEDQDEVRGLATRVLKAHGYRVLEAADGASALALVESHPGPIDLLLTDVVLPGMNGRELAACLKKLLPAVKVLYTSGYTYNVIAHRGVLDRDVAYIAKPYTPDGLAAKVREVLAA